MMEAGEPIDLATLPTHFKKRNQLEAIGGPAALADIFSASGVVDHLSTYAETLRDQLARRHAYNAAEAAARAALNQAIPLSDALAAPLEKLVKATEGTATRSRLTLAPYAQTFTRFLQEPITPKPTLLGSWLRQGDLGAIVAARGSGKTWFVQLIAAALATGKSMGDWCGSTARRVGIYDSEMALEDIHERAAMTGLQEAGDNAILLHYSHVLQARGAALNLASAKDQQLLLEWCANDGLEILILDNITTAVVGIEENDNDGFREKVQPLLLSARARGITLIIVGHQGRNGHWRGASSKEDLLDWTLLLSADWNAPDGELWAKSIFGKFRRSREGNPPLKWRIKGTPGEPVAIQCESFAGKEAMYQMIQEGIVSHSELKDELGVSGGTISKWGKVLIDNGQILKDGKSHYKIAA